MDDWEDLPSQPFRDRSNTWPRVVPLKPGSSPPPTVPDITEEESEVQFARVHTVSRNKQRRNVWGNKSYSELITEAILSTDEKRMLLSQIYNWMVKNVACFNDKHADNSSAGWKNSIRHNLSLHDCFMKLPNEQTGKSHWWVLNPNAKTSKTHRRRMSVHHNPIMDVDKLDEPFRRRTKSDCSAYKRPSPPSPSSYSPNCSDNSYKSEFEKQEANDILDSIIEAMKLDAQNKVCCLPGEQTDDCINTNMCKQETSVLASCVTEALKIETEDNKYLEAVEPVSASPPIFSENFTSLSALEHSADLMPLHPDTSLFSLAVSSTPYIMKESLKNQYSVYTAESPVNNVYISSTNNQPQTTQVSSLFNTCKCNEQQSFLLMHSSNRKESEVFQSSVKRSQYELKQPKCEHKLSVDPTVEYRSALQFPSLKQVKNDDSSGRPRSKSYSGLISKREFLDKPRQEATLYANVTQCRKNFEILPQDNYEELSLLDLEPLSIFDDWLSSTMLSTSTS